MFVAPWSFYCGVKRFGPNVVYCFFQHSRVKPGNLYEKTSEHAVTIGEGRGQKTRTGAIILVIGARNPVNRQNPVTYTKLLVTAINY